MKQLAIKSIIAFILLSIIASSIIQWNRIKINHLSEVKNFTLDEVSKVKIQTNRHSKQIETVDPLVVKQITNYLNQVQLEKSTKKQDVHPKPSYIWLITEDNPIGLIASKNLLTIITDQSSRTYNIINGEIDEKFLNDMYLLIEKRNL